MVERKQILTNKTSNQRELKEYDKYPDELIECATFRPEKYHILEQKEYKDCIITSYHKIINSEYLDVERELINEKLLNSGKYNSKYDDDVQYRRDKTRFYESNSIDEDQYGNNNIINSGTCIIVKGDNDKIVSDSEQESSDGVDNEYFDDDELEEEYNKLCENLDEEDEENNNELLLLLKGRERSKRNKMRDALNLPNSDYLILRNFPVSFGIPIISVKKLNAKPILLLWFIASVLTIYGMSLFLNEYVINDIIPLYDMDNIIFQEPSVNDGEIESKGVISSFLRSNKLSSPSFNNNNILKRLFPSFITKNQRIYGDGGNDYKNSELSVTLDLKNCHVQFLDSKSELSYIKIRSWRIFSQSQLYSGSLGRYRISKKVRDKYEYICSHNPFMWGIRKYILPLSWNKYSSMTWKEYKEYCDKSSRPWNYINDTNLYIKLHQSNTGDYFQCSINFFLSNKFKFNELNIRYAPTSNYMRVSSNVPIYTKKSFHLEALHGIFDLKDIYSPNTSISLSDGWCSLDIPNRDTDGNNSSNVLIESRGASVYINSRVPLMVIMPIRVAELSVLRSKYIKVNLDKKNSGLDHLNYYKSGSVIAKLNTNKSFYSGNGLLYKTRVNIQGTLPPVYVNVNEEYGYKKNNNTDDEVEGLNSDFVDEELETWVGKYQLMDPHLFLFSRSRFESFNKWLQEDLSSPWVLHINILGNSEYPKGTWKAVSSRAFIRDAYGLVLISGGLLRPRTYNLYVHILGLKCLSPVDHSDLEDLDVISVDNVNKGDMSDFNALHKSELEYNNFGGFETSIDNSTNEKSENGPEGVEISKKNDNESIFKNITRRFNNIIKNGEGKKSEKPILINLKDMFGKKYGTRILSNNIQETLYFDGMNGGSDANIGNKNNNDNVSELFLNYGGNNNIGDIEISNINQVGSYIGKSNSVKSCESSIIENIFSVINSAIMETTQQPSVIVWTQNKNMDSENDFNSTRLNNLKCNQGDIKKCKVEGNTIKKIISNNIMRIFKKIYSFLYLIKKIIFPSWLIPGWSNLSKKITKSSILAEDDYNNIDLNMLIEGDSVYNNNNNQFIYTAENDAILRDLVTANDLQGYIVSLMLNIVCAVFVAAFSMWVLYYYVFPWFLTGIRELQLVSTASHRLNHDFRTSETGEWIVMVSVIQWPEFGLLLRWNQRQKRLNGEKICIYIKQVEMNNINDHLAEFFLYIPANETSLTTHFGRNQQELFVPMKYTDKCIFEVTMPYELVSDNKYRLRILRISSFGHIIEQSNWSNEIIPGDKMRFVDFPLLFLRRFLPIRRSSLNLFIDKNTDHYSPFGIPFYFKNIEIIIFDALDGKRKKRNSFSLEYFDDDYLNENNKDNEIMGSDSVLEEGKIINIDDKNNEISTNMNDYISYGELKGKHKYLLVARLVRDFEYNNENGKGDYNANNIYPNGITGIINGNNVSSDFNVTSISNDDDSITSLKSYIFKNKSFDSDKVRIEGNLENINIYNKRFNHDNMNDVNSYNNVFILRNRGNSVLEFNGKNSYGKHETNKDDEYFDENNSLYLEQNLISQRRILFELQEADSGQIIANGDIKCSKLIEIAWKSLTNNQEDSEDGCLGINYNRRTLDTDVIQVHDTISSNTISINKFVNVSINLYYVEGGQWGELSMSLDRSFWVQYLRHDLSNDIIIDFNKISTLECKENEGKNVEMSRVVNTDTKDLKKEDKETENNVIKPKFVNDTPGKIVINGSDTQINWEWKMNAKDSNNNINYVPKKIYLHLFDHCTDTFLTSLHSEKTVPNNGTYAWSVDIPFISQRSSSRDVYLVMSVSIDEIPSNIKIRGKMMASKSLKYNSNNNGESNFHRADTKNMGGSISGNKKGCGVDTLSKQVIVAVSNSFKVIRLTTISEFEFLYATFCRTFGLEMEVVTYNDLSKYGFHVSKNNLRICENIRKSIPSEVNYGGTYCPGQYTISSKALAVKIGNNCDINKSNDKSDTDMESYMFLKSQRKYIDIIENCTLNYSTYWWLSSPDRFLLKNGIILDTSIFLPLTIKIMTLLKIDLLILYMRNLSITKMLNRFKRRFSIFDRYKTASNNDFYLQEDDFGGGYKKTINISSGLLVHSNYSTVYRRRPTWRSGKLNAWRIILNFVSLKGHKNARNGSLNDIDNDGKYRDIANINDKTEIGRNNDNNRFANKMSKEMKTINKSKRRWSNALMSLKLAQLKKSPSKLFSTGGRALKKGYIALGRGDNNDDLDEYKSGDDNIESMSKSFELESSGKFSREELKEDNNDASLGSMRESSCKYTELTNLNGVGHDRRRISSSSAVDYKRMKTRNDDDCMFYGYNIGYGGILVPLYIAKIKQRQEIIREIWYKLQFSTFPVVFKAIIYVFQLTLLSIFPITCIILTLLYNYLSTQTISRPHTYISENYLSDIVFNPRWSFFMSISFPVPYLILISLLHLLIINITFISSNTSYSAKASVINNNVNGNNGRMNRFYYYWIRILIFFEDIGMFITLFSTFLTLLAISMFFLWFLLGSLINSDNILPYVVMLLALGFVIVSLWNNFTSSRGIVDKFIAENLQSLISIALGHWFEATNQNYNIMNNSVVNNTTNSNYCPSFSDPNDLRSKISEKLQYEILNNRYAWSKNILDEHKYAHNLNNSTNKRYMIQDYMDVMELKHSTKMSRMYGVKSSSFSILNDYCDMYCLKWEYMKISPINTKRLFKLCKNGDIVGINETISIYYGMKLATKKDVLLNNSKINGLLSDLDIVLLKDGIKYGSKYGYKLKDFTDKDNNWYKFALVKIPIFPTSNILSEEAKIKLIFDFFDVDQDGYLNKKETLQWIINLNYNEKYFVNGDNTKYTDIVEYINSIFNLNVDDRYGFVIDDIYTIYSFNPKNVNIDYEKIIPVFNYSCYENMDIKNVNNSLVGERDRSGSEFGFGVEFDQKKEQEGDNNENCGIKNKNSNNKLIFVENYIDEEEYDDEFEDNIFKLSGSEYNWVSSSNNGLGNSVGNNLEENNSFVSLLDQKGYLWTDLLSNDNNNIMYKRESRCNNKTTEIKVITTDLNNLKLVSLNKIKVNYDIVSNGNKGKARGRKKYNKFQLLREINVQKLKYIFTFATRNLKTPDIETALKDIHSLAYKVFDAQIALLIPIFGVNNVLTSGNVSLCLRDKSFSNWRKEIDGDFKNGNKGNNNEKRASILSLGNKNSYQASSQLLSSFSSTSFVNWNGAGNTRGTFNDSNNLNMSMGSCNLNNVLTSGNKYQRKQSINRGGSFPNMENNINSDSNGNVITNSNNNNSNIGYDDGLGETEEDTVKFLQLMRILHNEIRQDIWLLFNHILGKLFNNNRVKNGANHFLDTIYPKLVRSKAARIVNIFYGPSLNELSVSIHEYFASAPPKTAAQVMDALKEYRVENQRNVKDTLEIISLSQGNASIQFQVSLITKALYALSLLKDNDVEMLTVDIPWKKHHTFITEEVLILPKNHQGMKLILESIQIVLRRVNSITGTSSGGGSIGMLLGENNTNANDGGNNNDGNKARKRHNNSDIDLLQSSLIDSRYIEEAHGSTITNNEFTETTLEQIIQIIVSRYLWMDSFIFLIRLCGINLSTDRLPSVVYDNSASITNLNYIEERNLEHVKNIFTKLSNGSGFLPVELSDLAIQTLTDKCLNFPGLLVSMNFLGLISNNMFLLCTGNPMDRLNELGFGNFNVVNVNHKVNINDLFSQNYRSRSRFEGIEVNKDDKYVLENLLFSGDNGLNVTMNGGIGNTVIGGNINNNLNNNNNVNYNASNKMLIAEKTCNYGELLDWTLLSNVKGIPDDIVKDFRSIAILRCGFIGRSQLHDYITQHRKLYINEDNIGSCGTDNIDSNDDNSNGNTSKDTANNIKNKGGSFDSMENSKYFEKMTMEDDNWLSNFNISFDIFDVALTTLGFSSHKLQSYILWLLLCLNINLDSIQLFINARLARDFITMLYLKPKYKCNDNAGASSGNNTHNDNNVVNDGIGISSVGISGNNNSNNSTINCGNNNDNNSASGLKLNSSHKSSMFDLSYQQYKDLDAQDVEYYNGYFTYEMLRRFLVLAKITIPDKGVKSIWESLPKDPLDVTNFISPYKNISFRNTDTVRNNINSDINNNIDFKDVKLTKKKSFGERFKRKVTITSNLDSGSYEDNNAYESNYGNVNGEFSRSNSNCGCGGNLGIENATEKESFYLRILMDQTGMDPMEGVIVSITTVKRLVPKKLMTGLWPEAIKVLLNIGLHLEKSDLSIMEATSRCLEYSNKYGLIRPGDIVSILAALNKEGLSFDLLCELLNNMRIQLPVRDVKRMFDLMDLNQDKSLDLQELLDGFEVLFGLFLPKLVHVHVGLSYERQSIIIIATSTALLLFCAFVGIAIKTFEGMRNELSTAVQSVLAIVGAVGLQTGASKDSSEIEERMKERIEDIMGGDIDTSTSQIEYSNNGNGLSSGELLYGNVNSNTALNGNNNKIVIKNNNATSNGDLTTNSDNGNFILTEKGTILKISYNYSYNMFPCIPNDPKPCITFYCNDYVHLEPVFYCTKGIVNQQNNSFFFENVNIVWSIKPNLPKYTGLTFNTKNGIIKGTIPLYFNNKKRQYIKRNTISDLNKYIRVINNSKGNNNFINTNSSTINVNNSSKLLRKISNINISNNTKSSKATIFKKFSSTNNHNNSVGEDEGDLYYTDDIEGDTRNKRKEKGIETGGRCHHIDNNSDNESSEFNSNNRIHFDHSYKESDEYLFDFNNGTDYENNDNTNTLLAHNNQFVQMNKQIFNVYCTVNELNEKIVYKTRITFQILPGNRK